MKKISVILITALLLFGLTSCSGAKTPPVITTATEPPVKNPVNAEYKGSEFTYKILGVRATAKSLFNPIPTGEPEEIYFIVFVQISNTSGSIQSINSMKNFGLRDKNGKEIRQVFDANNYNQPDYEQINPGDTKRGEIAYKVASNAEELVFVIKDNNDKVLYTTNLTVPALEEKVTTPADSTVAPADSTAAPTDTTKD